MGYMYRAMGIDKPQGSAAQLRQQAQRARDKLNGYDPLKSGIIRPEEQRYSRMSKQDCHENFLKELLEDSIQTDTDQLLNQIEYQRCLKDDFWMSSLGLCSLSLAHDSLFTFSEKFMSFLGESIFIGQRLRQLYECQASEDRELAGTWRGSMGQLFEGPGGGGSDSGSQSTVG